MISPIAIATNGVLGEHGPLNLATNGFVIFEVDVSDASEQLPPIVFDLTCSFNNEVSVRLRDKTVSRMDVLDEYCVRVIGATLRRQ